MEQDGTLTIDIEKIVREKAGSKFRWIPRVMISWLKRIVHQDEVNKFLADHSQETGVEWLKSCVKYLDMNITLVGEENLPSKDDGRFYTFVSNHPLGGPDGVALGAVIGNHFDGNIRYLLNDILMNLPGLKPLGIPINKTGAQGRNIPEMVNKAFHSTFQMILFPAGICSRSHNGVIRDVPWKKTFISKSVETQRDIIPIFFSGHNSPFFYRMANVGKRLGLKFNIAMLFLVDEMYKNVHKEFVVKIGKPIPWQTFDQTRSVAEWAGYVQNIVYNL